MSIRKWALFAIMLAFIVTMMPSQPRAQPSRADVVPVLKMHENCAGHNTHQAPQTPSHKDTTKKSCCDDAACACPNNFCNGVAKILGVQLVDIAVPAVADTAFSFTPRIMASEFHTRIKRPPRT